jgi:hypothetical protein
VTLACTSGDPGVRKRESAVRLMADAALPAAALADLEQVALRSWQPSCGLCGLSVASRVCVDRLARSAVIWRVTTCLAFQFHLAHLRMQRQTHRSLASPASGPLRAAVLLRLLMRRARAGHLAFRHESCLPRRHLPIHLHRMHVPPAASRVARPASHLVKSAAPARDAAVHISSRAYIDVHRLVDC